MFKCKYCDQEFESNSLLRNHYRWQHKKAKKVACKYCEKKFDPSHLSRHEKGCSKNSNNISECLECGKKISIKNKFCNNSCSAKFNNKNGKTGYSSMWKKLTHPHYNKENGFSCYVICFRNWEKKCAICGWDISVDVHHIDYDHTNNSQDNLIPLCPNCHRLTQINEYKEKMLEKIKIIMGSGTA